MTKGTKVEEKKAPEPKPLSLEEAYEQAPEILKTHIQQQQLLIQQLKAKIKQAVNLFLE